MPSGFQVFNADGSLQFDTSTQLFRFISSFDSGTVNGSRTFPGLSALGTGIAWVLGNSTGTLPTATVSGDTVSWTFDSRGTDPIGATIFVVVK